MDSIYAVLLVLLGIILLICLVVYCDRQSILDELSLVPPPSHPFHQVSHQSISSPYSSTSRRSRRHIESDSARAQRVANEEKRRLLENNMELHKKELKKLNSLNLQHLQLTSPDPTQSSPSPSPEAYFSPQPLNYDELSSNMNHHDRSFPSSLLYDHHSPLPVIPDDFPPLNQHSNSSLDTQTSSSTYYSTPVKSKVSPYSASEPTHMTSSSSSSYTNNAPPPIIPPNFVSPPPTLPLSLRYPLPPMTPSTSLQNEFLALRIQHSRQHTPTKPIRAHDIEMVYQHEMEKQKLGQLSFSLSSPSSSSPSSSSSSLSSLSNRSLSSLSAHDYQLIAMAMKELEMKKARYKQSMKRKRLSQGKQKSAMNNHFENNNNNHHYENNNNVNNSNNNSYRSSSSSSSSSRRDNHHKSNNNTVIKIAPSAPNTDQETDLR